MSSSVYVDNRKKDTIIFGQVQLQVLDDTALTVEAKYSINFSE